MRVLVVEDDPQFGSMVRNLLESEGIETELATRPSEAFDKLMITPIDAILLDLSLGDESGMSVLRELHTSGSVTPIVVMTGRGSIETVSEAMQLEAFDYITKPFSKDQILEVLRRAAASTQQETKRETTGKTIRMIGQSPVILEVYKAIERVAKTDSAVLITGERGTGKEIAARGIHEGSIRSKKPFLTVNCGAMNEDQLESELFGYVKSALAGSPNAHRGLFEIAGGGTVFLDEINAITPSLQAKLLHVLQQGVIKPAGSKEERHVDVRVIASTTQPPEKLLLSSFRRDLLYKLSVIHIPIPALRERQEDIPLLAHHFLFRCNKRQRKSVAIPDATIEWMKTLPWEGNVGELENAIERAVTLNETGIIQVQDFIDFGLYSKSIPTPGTAKSPEPGRKAREVIGLDDLFDNVNDIIYTRDLDGAITSLNAAGERFFGHQRDEIIGRTLHELFHDPDMEKNLRATNEKLIETGTDRSVVSIMDHTGKLRHLEFNVSLTRDGNGMPAGARGIMRDVTEAKELEQELRNRTKELEELNEKLKELDRIKADFAAMLAHDLKTPTSTMILALEFLQERLGGKEERVEQLISTGLSSGRTILKLVEDMLDIFRSDSNKMELTRTVLTIPELLKDPLQETFLQAQKKRIEVFEKYEENLPQVSVDKTKMIRAISNLLSNALKFTTPGGKVSLEVSTGMGTGVNADSPYVEICVIDTGRGIAAEHLSYIFDPYWQSPLKGVGTGLGLAVVKRIVSAHGGLVFVRSKLGVGSEFHIMLPAMN